MFPLGHFQPSPDPALVEFDGGGVILWNEGKPRARNGRTMAKEQAQEVFHAIAATPYEGEWDPDTQSYKMEPEYEGLTKHEVIVLKLAKKAANGDNTAIKEWNDRLLGKPKQAVESVSMHLSYSEILDKLAEQEGVTDEPPPQGPPGTTIYDTVLEDDEDDEDEDWKDVLGDV